MHGLDSLVLLAQRVTRWLGVRWRLFDIQRLRRDYTHADLPRLVIEERELRP